MDARTREGLPVLPMRVRTVGQRRKDAAALREAARHAAPGEVPTAAGQQLERAVVPHGTAGRVWAENPSTGKRRDLGLEEERAFWTWANISTTKRWYVKPDVEDLRGAATTWDGLHGAAEEWQA
ncbi:hypothetical protein [Streptomyces sp. NBC_01174]|uniref:hypothetical protein n=1 Tax=Streptomyces sp. NBC_01174 TaxID=2903758 RepID=UPI003866A4BD|nr:hypothetical protein OG414_29970 [Streptomyces sp. NBC_01174]